MIAKVCDRESKRDVWFKNHLFYFLFQLQERIADIEREKEILNEANEKLLNR